MKKLLTLSFALFIIGTAVFAQNIVSTDPENKNVVLEEFTGIHCVFCPDGHAIAQSIQDANPDDVFLINIHTGSYAVPSGSEPDFRTEWGSAIAGQSGLAGYPAGTVNRHLFPGWSQASGTAMSRSRWAAASNLVMGEASYLNVGLEATIVTSTRQLIVEVEVYYTGDSPESTNQLNVAILQDNIYGPQTGGGAGNNYKHMHMLRHLLTGQWGVDITQTTEGTLYSQTFAYELPMDYVGVDVVLEDIDIVAYVTETNQEVVSGNSAGDIIFIESNDYDAAVTSVNIPQTGCNDNLIPEVTIKNYGVVELTSLEFAYSVNGEDEQTYSWTGNLPQFGTEVITLPLLAYIPTDNNSFNLHCDLPNGVQDELPQNDTYSQDYMGSITYPENASFLILVSQNPESVTWSIVDGNGTAIAEGGPYTNNGFFYQDFTFPETGCYELIVNDATGEGLGGGLYAMGDEDYELLWTGGAFTYSTKAELAYGMIVEVEETISADDISIHPNPVTNLANIEFNLNNNSNVNITIFDVLGKKVMDIHNGELSGGAHNIKLNSEYMQQGIYFVRLQMNNQIVTKKILISN